MLAGERQRLVVHTPPRHGKSESLLAFIAWALWNRPSMQLSYSSYDAGITRSKSRVALGLVRRLGVTLASENITEWRTPERGGLLAKSVTEGITGQGIELGVIDDPVKGRLQAESKVYRDRAKEWVKNDFLTRLEPNASAICLMTRWHPDDLSGYLINEKGWEFLCLPAISPEGAALWPERWPLSELQLRRSEVGAYVWESLYQGAPRPRGGAVFGDAWLYTVLPQSFRVAIGIDLAYSKKTASDYSVAVVMLEANGYYFIADVVRAQVRAPQFGELVKQLLLRYPTARVRWYAAGTEQGSADFMREAGIPRLETLPPKGDKFVRAIPYAAAWNAHRVLVPDSDGLTVPWLAPFLEEHASFTGTNDDYDDQVDAADTAFDLLADKAPSYAGLPERTMDRRDGQDGRRRM